MLIDFLIGLFAANALPHYLVGRFDGRILGLFGYGPKANMVYSFLCTAIALGLFQIKYGLDSLVEHGMLLGVFCVVFGFYAGWPIIDRYLRQQESPNR